MVSRAPDPIDRTGTERAETERVRRARRAAAAVLDPELPGLTIADLGILRDVGLRDGVIVARVTPTFSGCPAITAIQSDLDRALRAADVAPYTVETVLRPPWSSAWITDDGRAKLRRAGIAPPPERPETDPKVGVNRRRVDVTIEPVGGAVTCPRCGASATTLLSEYGATACRSLRRCDTCREPFDAVKAV